MNSGPTTTTYTPPAQAPAGQQFGYIDKSGVQRSITSPSAQQALASLPSDADPRSGIISPPIGSTPKPGSSTTTPPPTPASGTTSRQGASAPKRGSVEELGAIMGETPTKPKSSKQIYAEKLAQSQGLIDAITNSYADTYRREQEAGAARDARTRALNVGAGLGGSDFASAAAIGTEKVTQANMASIDREKEAKIASILYNVQSRADEEEKALRTQYASDLETAYNARKDFRDKAIEDIKGLGSTGLDGATLKTKDPELYDKLLKQGGLSELELDSHLVAANPKIDISKVKTEKFGNTLLMTYVDPNTGAITQQKYDVGDTGFDGFTIAPDGTPLFYNKSQGTVQEAPGNYMKPRVSGSGTGGGNETAAEKTARLKTEMASTLKGAAGDDGFVDPQDWNSLRQGWQDQGQNVLTFDQQYQNYKNPKDKGYIVNSSKK